MVLLKWDEKVKFVGFQGSKGSREDYHIIIIIKKKNIKKKQIESMI